MRVLTFGKTGQVARELARLLPEARFLDRAAADLSDPGACADVIAAGDVDVVINAAAYTSSDNAESDEALATIINGAAPTEMARACAARNIPFIHISTDYVFDGSGQAAWQPSDATGPLGAYGRSKLAGEEGIRAAGGRHVILRTSWVFSAHGVNFVKTMLHLSESRDALNVVADQIGGPTAAADIAAACVNIARQMVAGTHAGGTYHFAGAPDVSWAGFARGIFGQAGRLVTVNDIPSRDYPTPAKRPENSRLDCTTLSSDFAIPRPDWRESLSRVLIELKGISQ